MTTKKKVEQPKVAAEEASAPPPALDPTLCSCTGVQRRWDTDGHVENGDGVNYYRCSVCGKRYSA